MLVAAFVLFFVYGLLGYYTSYVIGKRDRSSRIAGSVIMNSINNTLVVVFASQFFGTEVAAMTAIYYLAYYYLMLPMKKLFLIRTL